MLTRVLPRNLLFPSMILVHGFRRLFPPWIGPRARIEEDAGAARAPYTKAMRFAFSFLALGLICLVRAVTAGEAWQTFLLGSCTVASCGLGLAYASRRPGVLLKRQDGQLRVLGYLLYWPYLLMNLVLLRAVSRWGRRRALDEIDRGLYLGRRLGGAEVSMLETLGVRAVLDLTCELGEPLPMRCRGAYLCLPLLDATAPTMEQLRAGAAWIGERLAEGPVYVHCALGHGRSATFVAAWLLLSGRAASVEEAVSRIAAARPGIGLHPSQMARLCELARNPG